MAQETQTGSLYQPRGEGDGREVQMGGDIYIYTYGWVMVWFDRKQPNSVKQLSFNKKMYMFHFLMKIGYYTKQSSYLTKKNEQQQI